MSRVRALKIGRGALVGAILGMMLLLSACGGNSNLQQQASQAQSKLDKQLQYAKTIGVPASALQPITQQEQKLTSTGAPFSLFNDTAANTYYQNQTSSYQKLFNQLQTVIAMTTGQDEGKAQSDLQSFDQSLSSQTKQKVGDLQAFSTRYTRDKNLLGAAQTPQEFLTVSTDAENAVTALGMLSTTYAQMVILKTTISQMQQAHLDVTLMQTSYNADLTTFNTSTTENDFQNLDTLINAQYQEAVVSSTLSLPYVESARLQEFQNQLNQLKTYGVNTSSFQQRYDTDKANMDKAQTTEEFLAVSTQIDTDINALQMPLLKGQAQYQLNQLNKEANAWGQAHPYHDTFDGGKYILDSSYTDAGIGYWLQQELSDASTRSAYQTVVTDEDNTLFNLQMLEQDYSDKTPYNKVHQTDLEMMQHYPNLQHGMVLMVSIVEQAMRVYDNGKLINSFLVTTGRVELPSLAGVWTPVARESPTVFTSSEPKSSPYWYAPTNINYAIEYHDDGYFVHDSWWRNQYGPGTQFPHYDSSGNEASAGNGSHGCVNMQEQQAAWVYGHTDWSTQIAIY